MVRACYYSAEKKINKEELLFLTTFGSITKNGDQDLKPKWLLDKSWDEVCRLDKINVFNGINYKFILYAVSMMNDGGQKCSPCQSFQA